MAEQASATSSASPEEILTEIIALASGLDGVDIVVGAYEGFTYAVQARSPELEIHADEIAAASVTVLDAAKSRLPSEEQAKAVIAEYSGRGLLAADAGEKFTAAIIGEKRVLEEMAAPIDRIVSRKTLLCPSCGINLDIQNMICPVCGKVIPFTAKACPFCGYRVDVRQCPSCGAQLRVLVDKVELATSMAARREAAGTKALEKPTKLDRRSYTIFAGAATLVYYAIAYAAGLSPFTATLAGAPALALAWLTLYVQRSTRQE